VLARFAMADERFGSAFVLVTLSFLFLVPFAIGYLTVSRVERPSRLFRIFAPWASILLSVGVAWLVGWEGAICVILALPVLLVLSSLGGLVAGADSRHAGWRAPAVALLPFVTAPLEGMRPPPDDLQRNVTEIIIAAPPEQVWPYVVRVDPIASSEVHPALFTALGFPRPVSAVLNRSGVGAVRQARFEGGLVFVETVTAWAPNRQLAFDIDPQTADIPPSTLDPHVTVGGRYFDVLSGEYDLFSTADGGTRVVLTSTHRVSTTFNPYAGLWAGAIMRSIQSNILEVLRARAEANSAAEPAVAADSEPGIGSK
jgi:hypothetical protein